MAPEPAARGGQDGSILLPVMLLLLLIATAATAMTLKARTSLREAAIRRDRLVLASTADGMVRATALALAQTLATRKAPPFRLDGTPETCDGPAGRFILSVQDTAGLVDLNKASTELIQAVLGRAGVGGPDALAVTRGIMAHRSDAPGAPPTSGKTAAKSLPGSQAPAQDFVLVDELADVPGVSPDIFTMLRPLFTTDSGANGIDPAVAAPAVQALFGKKELASPAFEAMVTPTAQSVFAIDVTVALQSGQQFTRHAAFRMEPSGATGRFTAWTAPLKGFLPPLDPNGDARFCRLVADTLRAGR